MRNVHLGHIIRRQVPPNVRDIGNNVVGGIIIADLRQPALFIKFVVHRLAVPPMNCVLGAGRAKRHQLLCHHHSSRVRVGYHYEVVLLGLCGLIFVWFSGWEVDDGKGWQSEVMDYEIIPG